MNLVNIKDIFKTPETFLNQEISVGGWVRSNRSSKAFGFLTISDGTFFTPLQAVYHDALDNFPEIAKCNVGTALIIRGTLVATPEAKQPFEIQAASVTVEGASGPDYPLQKKRHSLEYLRTITHLRPRTNTFQAVFRVRSLIAFAIHQFFNERGFVYVHTPLITGSDCEGAGEMFQVTTLDLNNVPKNEDGSVDYSQDFFNKETNLTVSGQLDVETFAMAFKNVYTFGPTFRAENSNTTRHAAEFWMIEPEMAFADLNDNMRLAEDLLKYVIRYVIEHAPEEMDFFNQFLDKGLTERLNGVLNSEFGHVTYTEAIEILKKNNDQFDYQVFWGCDLQTEHERYLTEQVFKRPVFVTDYPKEIKAFYMKLNEDKKTVAAMDCLVPGIGEIIGGSQREDDYDTLLARMHEMGLKEEDYGFYLDLRKYGSNRHSGFGLGFERLVMYLTGIGNIRDAIPFPRTVNNCDL
jgi:asparaginyl-tRNA synthetase